MSMLRFVMLSVGLIGLIVGCKKEAASAPATQAVPSEVSKFGSIEVTARLVEVPEGSLIQRDLYDYAAVLKYEVLTTHRGQAHAPVIYVAHYNPMKPRNQAADKRVKGIGGNVMSFSAGQIHRIAMESPLDDFYIGGVINKYFGKETGPIYWAVWTDVANP